MKSYDKMRNKDKKRLKTLPVLLIVVMLSMFLSACDIVDIALETSSTNNESQSVENGNQANSSSENVKVHFINTGNSDAILIQDNGVFALIDAGDNDDEQLMVDYLNKCGVEKIKYIISTHAHADHLGGLDAVVKNFDIEYALVSNGSAETKSYRDFINAMADKGLSPGVPLENKKFYLNNSYFEVLNTNGGKTTNDESLVVKYINGDDEMLFTGDIEKDTENEILDKVDKVDLLKVAHHGSRSSSTQAFLDKADPEYAIIFAEEGNRYGHPHKETMKRLEKMGIEVHRSDECGDIIFESTGNGLISDCQTIGSYIDGRSK